LFPCTYVLLSKLILFKLTFSLVLSPLLNFPTHLPNDPPMYFVNTLGQDFLVCDYESSCKFFHMEHIIQDELDLCSQARYTQNKLCSYFLKAKLVFLCQQLIH
jgi:hypothetical protein